VWPAPGGRPLSAGLIRREEIFVGRVDQLAEVEELEKVIEEDEWRTQTDEIQKGIEALTQEIADLEQRLVFILLPDTTAREVNPEVATPEDMETRERSLLIAALGRLRDRLRDVIEDIRQLKERLDI